jgi:predicted oxidoreductase
LYRYAVDGYNGEALEALVTALSDVPAIKVAFNRVEFSLAHTQPLEDGTMDACKRLGVGVVAAEPLGEGSRVVTETHPVGRLYKLYPVRPIARKRMVTTLENL